MNILGSCSGSIRLSIEYAAIHTLSTDDVDAGARSPELINIHKRYTPYTRYAQARYHRPGQNEEEGKMAAFKVDYPMLISDTD